MQKTDFMTWSDKEKPEFFSGQGLGKALPNKYLSVVEDRTLAKSGTMDDTCS